MITKPLKIVSYVRVSTARQGESGLGLEAQRAAVEAFARQHGGTIIASFVEVETGKRSDRPELAKALEAARKSRATLLIAKLDRLARNVAFIANLMDSGVEFLACDQPFASRLTLHILAAVAEDEARRISERTRAALQAAKARGTRLGAPNCCETVAKARAARWRGAEAARANIVAIVRDIQTTGITSNNGIARALMVRGIKTVTGSTTWQGNMVARLLAA
jgi:DNA invertase Pin-like site-specific DNA recombinase